MSSICELPFSELLALAGNIPTLQNQLFALMSQQLSIDNAVNLQATAEQNIYSIFIELIKALS